jgi:tripartite-type tricarboxylate transporter receptor subunit TctC
MNLNRREALALFCAGAAGSLSPLRALAEDWPARPLKLVIGYSTGGSTDATARIVGHGLEQRLGQPMVFEYKPGAGASMGAEFVAKSPADGYTIGLTDAGPMAIVPHLRKLGYDPAKDFTLLSYVCATGLAVLVHPSVPANNIKELIALAKANPDKYNYASSGVGSVHHLAGELFKSQAGVKLAHVPYRGAGPALTDLVGGQIPVMFATIGPSLQMIAAGKVKALGVTSSRRSKALPDVPTVAEQGLKGYEAVLWFSMVAPPNLPAPVAARLQKELQAVLVDPKVIEELEKLGNDDIGPRTPKEVAALVRAENEKWGRVIKEANITVDS